MIGVSAGARSAIELALRHPARVSALILVVPGVYSPDSPVAVESSRGGKVAFWMVNAGGDFLWWAAAKVAPSMLIRFLGVPPDLVAKAPRVERERVMAIVRGIEPLSRRAAGVNIDSHPDLGALPLERIGVPTLVISTRDDQFNTLPAATYTAARIPGARLVSMTTAATCWSAVGRRCRPKSTGSWRLRRSGRLPPRKPLHDDAVDVDQGLDLLLLAHHRAGVAADPQAEGDDLGAHLHRQGVAGRGAVAGSADHTRRFQSSASIRTLMSSWSATLIRARVTSPNSRYSTSRGASACAAALW